MPYPMPDDSIAFVYDGTLEGLLCAVFETCASKTVPADIATENKLQLRLGQDVRTITTSPDVANRVRAGLVRACTPAVYDAVRDASLSDDPHKGSIICAFIRYSMAERRNTLSDLAHPFVEPFVRLRRGVLSERHYMMQFLRFQELEGGVWFAQCNPKANVVPVLMDWFCARFNTQPFIIYDEVHNLAGVYQGRGWFLVQSDELNLPSKTADEVMMADAWRRFYEALSVEARYNPELRTSFMPKRLWKNISEVADQLPDTHPVRR